MAAEVTTPTTMVLTNQRAKGREGLSNSAVKLPKSIWLNSALEPTSVPVELKAAERT